MKSSNGSPLVNLVGLGRTICIPYRPLTKTKSEKKQITNPNASFARPLSLGLFNCSRHTARGSETFADRGDIWYVRYIYYGVHTVFLAWKSPNIRSCTVFSGQPYTIGMHTPLVLPTIDSEKRAEISWGQCLRRPLPNSEKLISNMHLSLAHIGASCVISRKI